MFLHVSHVCVWEKFARALFSLLLALLPRPRTRFCENPPIYKRQVRFLRTKIGSANYFRKKRFGGVFLFSSWGIINLLRLARAKSAKRKKEKKVKKGGCKVKKGEV
jgi:hypothetical protein